MICVSISIPLLRVKAYQNSTKRARTSKSQLKSNFKIDCSHTTTTKSGRFYFSGVFALYQVRVNRWEIFKSVISFKDSSN